MLFRSIMVELVQEGLTLEVYDAVGKLTKQMELNNNKTEINISEFAGGVYVYRIKNKFMELGHGKIVKE